MWKPIDGYFWPYRINEEGEVQRLTDSGEWSPIKACLSRTQGHPYGRLVVNMKRPDGKFRNTFVKTLMIDAFLGGKKPGVCYILKNGMQTDCSLNNIGMTTPTQVGKVHGGGLRKAVEKVDRDGNVVELYPSVIEASRKNYISRKSILIRCQNKVRDPYSLDGYTYRYEERHVKRSQKK